MQLGAVLSSGTQLAGQHSAGVAFSVYQAAQLKLPRQAYKGPFLVARVPSVKHMLEGKFKTNREPTATRDTLLLRGPIHKSHSPVLATVWSKLARAQKPQMHAEFPAAEAYMGWVKIDELIQWIKTQL